MNNTRWYVPSVFCLILIFTSCSGHKEGQWKGVTKIENGITVVKNPSRPMYEKTILELVEEISIGTASWPEEARIGEISCYTVDNDGNIYVGDSKNYCLKVFDNNGQYLRSMGRRGQGPGEFTVPPSKIQLAPSKEIIVSANSLKLFSPEGKFLYELKNPIFLFSDVLMDADSRLYLYRSEFDGKEKIYRALPPYESFVNIISVEEERTIPAPRLRYALISGHILAWGFSSEYRIHLADQQGKIIRIIEKEYKPWPLTADWKSKYLDSLPRGFPKEGHNFRASFPAFDYFFADDSGRLFVKTFEKEEATGNYLFDIFDPEGRYLTRIALKVGREISLKQDSFMIKNGKLYAEDYDSEGYSILKRYSLTWNLKSQKNHQNQAD